MYEFHLNRLPMDAVPRDMSNALSLSFLGLVSASEDKCCEQISLSFKPSSLYSPTAILKYQRGNCFDFSVLLCSMLIGAGYDAYCVNGYATHDICSLDETLEECPLLRKPQEVKRPAVSRQGGAWVSGSDKKTMTLVRKTKHTGGQ